MLFINGAEGNLAPIYTVYPDPHAGHLDEFRVLLGREYFEANRRIVEMTSDVMLTGSETTIETPLKPGLVWPPALAKYLRTAPGGSTLVRIPIRFLQINRETVIWGAPLEMFCESRSMYAATRVSLSPSTSGSWMAGWATSPPEWPSTKAATNRRPRPLPTVRKTTFFKA